MVGLATKTAFRVVLLTPRSKLLDCRAGVAVIPCTDGLRGILRNHCPFLTGLSQGIMQVRGIADRPDAFYILEGGFARFSENHLTVLAYDVVTFEGLNPEKVKQMVSHAKSVVVGQEYIKTQLQRTDVTRSRLVVRMAEMASLLTPES
jgi:F0F1-type ATP synthase epsilon subunit